MHVVAAGRTRLGLWREELGQGGPTCGLLANGQLDFVAPLDSPACRYEDDAAAGRLPPPLKLSGAAAAAGGEKGAEGGTNGHAAAEEAGEEEEEQEEEEGDAEEGQQGAVAGEAAAAGSDSEGEGDAEEEAAEASAADEAAAGSLTLHGLVRRMARLADDKTYARQLQRGVALRFIAAVASRLGPQRVLPYLPLLMRPLYRITEPGGWQQLAGHALS